MAARRPLVHVDGNITVLPAGDVLDGDVEGVPVFIQDAAPVTDRPAFVWFKTGMPGGGTDLLIQTP